MDIMATGTINMLPVISITIIATAIGALLAAPKRESMPIITKCINIVRLNTWGLTKFKRRKVNKPTDAPMNMPGAYTPPLPPEPTENDVASIFAKISMKTKSRAERPKKLGSIANLPEIIN